MPDTRYRCSAPIPLQSVRYRTLAGLAAPERLCLTFAAARNGAGRADMVFTSAMNFSPERLRTLSSCGDAASLRAAVSEMCTEFGKATRIDIFTMAAAEKRRALCFVRLESEAQERLLMTALGASRMGADLLVIVDLPS